MSMPTDHNAGRPFSFRALRDCSTMSSTQLPCGKAIICSAPAYTMPLSGSCLLPPSITPLSIIFTAHIRLWRVCSGSIAYNCFRGPSEWPNRSFESMPRCASSTTASAAKDSLEASTTAPKFPFTSGQRGVSCYVQHPSTVPLECPRCIKKWPARP